MATIGVREVAAECGVSFSTAAAALRGDSWVRPSTRAKVAAAARRLDYRIDAAASLLGRRRGHGPIAGYSLVYLGAMLGSPFPGRFSERLKGVESAARARGFLVERVEARSAAQLRKLDRRFDATGVDGILVGPVSPDAFLEHFRVDRYSLVADGRELAAHGFDIVRANHFLATQRLLDRLVERGYRRVGLLLRRHAKAHPDDHARLGAFMAHRELTDSWEVAETMCWPFHRDGLDSKDAAVAEQGELAAWNDRFRFDVIVGFDEADHPRVSKLEGPGGRQVDYAALIVRVPFRGKIAGSAFDQDVVAEVIVDRLAQKIATRNRGLSASPLESVVELPWIEGASLRRPAPGPT